jgi:hypothetical protein
MKLKSVTSNQRGRIFNICSQEALTFSFFVSFHCRRDINICSLLIRSNVSIHVLSLLTSALIQMLELFHFVRRRMTLDQWIPNWSVKWKQSATLLTLTSASSTKRSAILSLRLSCTWLSMRFAALAHFLAVTNGLFPISWRNSSAQSSWPSSTPAETRLGSVFLECHF